ncbi:hypothetical protein HMPREF9554_01566 [Treponema phagedenis F0421]|nr:hypothetical protein HMPREF9554_01566 [Treponema phagedenis F0421]
MIPSRIEFENYHSVLGVFKLISIILPRTAKSEQIQTMFKSINSKL